MILKIQFSVRPIKTVRDHRASPPLLPPLPRPLSLLLSTLLLFSPLCSRILASIECTACAHVLIQPAHRPSVFVFPPLACLWPVSVRSRGERGNTEGARINYRWAVAKRLENLLDPARVLTNVFQSDDEGCNFACASLRDCANVAGCGETLRK